MSRFVAWTAAAAVVAVMVAFHTLWVPRASNLSSGFFGFCALYLAVSIAISRRGGDWSHLPPARGRIVAVLPSFNETQAVLYRTIESLLAGSAVPDVIYVVDDGSMVPVEPYVHPRVVWLRQENTGKRGAQVNVLAGEIATRTADFIITIDSDSVLDRHCLRECMRAMSAPGVQAATATVTVLNRREHWLARLTDLEIVSGCLVARASRSRFGAVSPTAGTMSVYRAGVLFDNVADYLASGTVGDDRRLSHYSLLRGRVVFAESAIVETLMPTNFRQLFAQRTRWYRSYVRYTPWELRHLEGAALAIRAWQILLNVLYPLLIVWVFVVVPLVGGRIYWETLVYWVMILYCMTARYTVFERPNQPLRERILTWLFFTPLLIPFNVLVTRLAMYRAIPLARATGWQTRGGTCPPAAAGSGGGAVLDGQSA